MAPHGWAMTDILGLTETRRGYVCVFFEHRRELSEPVRADIRMKRNRYQRLISDGVAEGMGDGTFRGVGPDVGHHGGLRYVQLGVPVVAARQRRRQA